MSDQGEVLITVLIKHPAEKWWELRSISMRGLWVDSIPNSLIIIIKIV